MQARHLGVEKIENGLSQENIQGGSRDKSHVRATSKKSRVRRENGNFQGREEAEGRLESGWRGAVRGGEKFAWRLSGGEKGTKKGNRLMGRCPP